MSDVMAPSKLLAEWFWTDRWTGSRGFLLPMEARGLYREMLTQAWRRGARLPEDLDAIRRLVGISAREWRRSWPLVEPFWTTRDGYLVNETQVEVYREAEAQAERYRARAQSGGLARKLKHNLSSAQAELKQCSSTTQAVLESCSLVLTNPPEKEKLKQKEKVSPQADWFAECQRMHGGECGLNQQRHHLRKELELARR
jgi:uncharacterized protein YdaU (DUF1376 family)